jgi:hypothetical protein
VILAALQSGGLGVAPLLVRASWSLHPRHFSGRFSAWDCFFFSGFLQFVFASCAYYLGM